MLLLRIMKNMFPLFVLEGGTSFVLNVELSKMLQDSDVMHKWWSRSGIPDSITAFHPRCLAFSNVVNQRCQKVYRMVSLGHCFSSQFAVRENISEQYNMILLPHSTFVICVDLKSVFAVYSRNTQQDDISEIWLVLS